MVSAKGLKAHVSSGNANTYLSCCEVPIGAAYVLLASLVPWDGKYMTSN